LFLNYVDIAAYNAFVIQKMNVDGARDAQLLIKQRKQFLETLGKHLVQPNIDRRRETIECDGRGYKSSVIRAIEACEEKKALVHWGGNRTKTGTLWHLCRKR